MNETFGEFVKELRIKKELTLREFCKMHGLDPGNWSKIERGLLYPPENDETLNNWASYLGIKNGSSEWFRFMDLASLTRGKIPADILEDEELMNNVPLFFRTIRGEKPSEPELRKLLKIIRKS
jgi:transcriptional regulator with XRE-family HTH domain